MTSDKAGKIKIENVLRMAFLVTCHVSLVAPALYACPTCNDIISRGADAFKTMKFGEGIAWSMVPLFGVPFMIAGSLVWIIVRASKKRNVTSDK